MLCDLLCTFSSLLSTLERWEEHLTCENQTTPKSGMSLEALVGSLVSFFLL